MYYYITYKMLLPTLHIHIRPLNVEWYLFKVDNQGSTANYLGSVLQYMKFQGKHIIFRSTVSPYAVY